MTDNITLQFITVSYAPDIERCRRLCKSLDTYCQNQPFRHLIICPERDLPIFQNLQHAQRQIMSYQAVLPDGFRHLPILAKWWLDPGFFPIRGWIMQQLIKIAAAAASNADYVVIADSDIVFCRNVSHHAFNQDGAIRLLAKPLQQRDKDHTIWQRLSERLLWITPQHHFPNYVGQLMSWSPAVVRDMLARIEHNSDKPWYKTLGRLMTFSEYTLYGNFAQHLYEGSVRHFEDTTPISLDLWSIEDVIELRDKKVELNPKMIAVLVQSNLMLTPKEEEITLQHAVNMLQTTFTT